MHTDYEGLARKGMGGIYNSKSEIGVKKFSAKNWKEHIFLMKLNGEGRPPLVAPVSLSLYLYLSIWKS